MRNQWIAGAVLAACLFMPVAVIAGYKDGAHQWDVSGGKLVVMTGVMADNAAERYLNYTFYVRRKADDTLYQVPILKGSDMQKFDLSTVSSGDGENSAQDVRIVMRRHTAYLLIAEKGGDNSPYGAGPVDVRIYVLVEGNDGDWAYYFKPAGIHHYPASSDATVERALAASEKRVASGG